MSLVLCVYLHEGLVLASDSRMVFNRADKNPKTGAEVHLIGTLINDSATKIFACPNGTGIAMWGDASIDREPLSIYVDSFIHQNITTKTDIDDIPDLLLEYFQSLPNVPKTSFYVAGYKKTERLYCQKVYSVDLFNKKITSFDVSKKGATWSGESDTLIKLLNPVSIKTDTNYSQLPQFDIPWNLFSLQDGVNFADFAIQATIDLMSFQNRIKSVGGPIDILVIKPNETTWVRKKNLTVPR